MKHLRLFPNEQVRDSVLADIDYPVLHSTDGVGLGIHPGSVVPPIPSHDYVEIGGVKWATMNIGASTIYDTGLYFQWGDTQGYTVDQVGEDEGKKSFDKDHYLYCSDYEYTKYNSEDGLNTLESSDDAVVAAWGGNWRMPTAAEFQALGQAVNAVWTENYNNSGVNGLVCTDKTDSSKVLFFPAAGYGNGSSFSGVGDFCNYWSSSKIMDPDSADQEAYESSLSEDSMYWGDITENRYCGLSVRGVLDQN